MPKLIYALMCADLIIDKESSSTSFIRTIEHAVVPELPSVLPPVYFASLWDLEGNEEAPFTVSLKGQLVNDSMPERETPLHVSNG